MNAVRHPDRIALFTKTSELTFLEVQKKSERAAAAFQSAGTGKGDAVALMNQNIFDFVISFFGIFKAGGAAVPGNRKLTVPEVDYILENSGAKLFLFDSSLAPAAKVLDTAV